MRWLDLGDSRTAFFRVHQAHLNYSETSALLRCHVEEYGHGLIVISIQLLRIRFDTKKRLHKMLSVSLMAEDLKANIGTNFSNTSCNPCRIYCMSLHVQCHHDKGQLELCQLKSALLEATPQPTGWGEPCLPIYAMIGGPGR